MRSATTRQGLRGGYGPRGTPGDGCLIGARGQHRRRAADGRCPSDRVRYGQPRRPGRNSACVRAAGDNGEANYRVYLDWLVAQGVVKTRVDVKDLITDELLADVNKFDADAIRRDARAFKAK